MLLSPVLNRAGCAGKAFEKWMTALIIESEAMRARRKALASFLFKSIAWSLMFWKVWAEDAGALKIRIRKGAMMLMGKKVTVNAC